MDVFRMRTNYSKETYYCLLYKHEYDLLALLLPSLRFVKTFCPLGNKQLMNIHYDRQHDVQVDDGT